VNCRFILTRKKYKYKDPNLYSFVCELELFLQYLKFMRRNNPT